MPIQKHRLSVQATRCLKKQDNKKRPGAYTIHVEDGSVTCAYDQQSGHADMCKRDMEHIRRCLNMEMCLINWTKHNRSR